MYLLQERQLIKMVGNIRGIKQQMSICAPLLRVLLANLTVLHHAVLAIDATDDADGFGRFDLAYDLGATLCVFREAETEEDGVSYADEAVVHAVGVQILYAWW